MGTEHSAPNRAEVEAWFVALLTGAKSRDEADRWAARWSDATVDDELVQWALELLYGIDLPADSPGTFLHDDEQLRGWLAEFRGRLDARPASERGAVEEP